MNRKCKYADDQAEQSGSGHDDDEDLDSENEEDRAFIDDGSVCDENEDSPIHDSELEADDDDRLLIEDHLEEEEHKAAVHRAKRFKAAKRRKAPSSSDEADSMDDVIEDDEMPIEAPFEAQKPMEAIKAAPAAIAYKPIVLPNGRRPLESMANFTNFRPVNPEDEPQRQRTWGFMMASKPPPPPAKPTEHGYIRVAGALMYRKRDGTLKPATGVDAL